MQLHSGVVVIRQAACALLRLPACCGTALDAEHPPLVAAMAAKVAATGASCKCQLTGSSCVALRPASWERFLLAVLGLLCNQHRQQAVVLQAAQQRHWLW